MNIHDRMIVAAATAIANAPPLLARVELGGDRDEHDGRQRDAAEQRGPATGILHARLPAHRRLGGPEEDAQDHQQVRQRADVEAEQECHAALQAREFQARRLRPPQSAWPASARRRSRRRGRERA
jgi:hypothetical protein